MNGPLVSASWLLEHLADGELLVVDTRFALGKPDAGRTAFEAGHLPGAVFADLERDLTAPVRADRDGGRHPIPPVEHLEALFSRLGVSRQHHVVAYDDPSAGTGFYAAHLWWLLRYLGHDNVSVLDGGLPAWLAAGGELETAVRTPQPTTFRSTVRPEMIVEAAGVSARPGSTGLVDSRAPERYRGEVEPLDWKAGHIPGAININWSDGLQEGRWTPAEEQQDRFPAADATIVYCGSGVSAAANLLAMELAGVENVKLYPGSWSDWISDPGRPIETSLPD